MAKSEKDKTFDNLPTFVAEYIKLVIKKMGYRKKARVEVQDELIDHFETALKDCVNEQEKQKKANLMIAEFGDAKLLGVLMRRAKKRCRPLWRTAVVRAFQTVGILIICLILYIAWFITGKPVITTDYIAELNKIVRPTADDSLNAATLYNKAIETLVDINDVEGLLRTDFYDADDEQKKLISRWLAKNDASFALVTEGSKLPYCWQRYESKDPEQSMMSVSLPNLGPPRQIGYALCWRAWLNAQSGEFKSAFEDIETCYRFGRHYKGEKTLIEQLVGIGIEGIALGTIRQMLDTYKIDSNALADFQQRIQRLIDTEDFRLNIQLEKLFMYDIIQRCLIENHLGLTHVYLKGLCQFVDIPSESAADSWWSHWSELFYSLFYYHPEGHRFLLRVFLTHPSKAQTIAAADAFYKLLDEQSKTSLSTCTERTAMEDIVKDSLLLDMFTPAFGRINIIAWRNKVDAESTLVVIALVRYRQDTGNHPETLGELVEQGYINQIPIDPFSDKPLIYRTTADSCILYSVGLNFTDDGGQVARDKNDKVIMFPEDEGDWVFWPVTY